MGFRKSRFVDFDKDVVRVTPMDLLGGIKPPPAALGKRLDLFECQVDVWYLAPAVAMLKQIESHDVKSVWAHSAYSLLSLVFSYFEMIGKTLNPAARAKGTAGLDFNYGFCDVYPGVCPSDVVPSDTAVPDVREIRERVRNGMYHLGDTKCDVLIHNVSASRDFVVERRHGAILVFVNPHQVTRRIVDHFPTFMARLRSRSKANHLLRQRFVRFFTEFKTATSI